ncbi:DNA-binding helix-turn-helix protein [Fusobacterium nucleatum subsp. nucleatum ATCC 23726]|uniref:DNA-binding helix-turn-helix protein n=2 Tax=Fusobacterium nucleatum TaxID=851 RepID=D5RAG5_FUSN2|nr:DNA-binding helix-turn-helix protein [Fusobacterium nucleatum subsp. nucleatum ATCC 23726]
MKKDKIVYNKKELLRKDNIKMNKEINVGITIKNIRKSKKLLLKDVALKCGISSSMLSQIEKGNANPSLNTIKSIAQVLEVPLFKFFMDLEKEKYEFHLLKKDDRKIISTEYVTYELLSPDVETNIECMQMTLIGKNAETSVKPMAHKGEEIAVLLNGKVKLTIGKFSIVLSSGDSIHIPSMTPHKWTNLHTEKSVVIFSVSPPEF